MPPKLQPWKIPRIWDNATCYILGGGPGLQVEEISPGQYRSPLVEALRGEHIVAVNNAFKLGNWIDAMFFGDCRWLNQHQEALANFAGLKITTCARHQNRRGIKVIRKRNSPYGIALDPHTVAWNLSSGACAINVAVHLGAKRIVLLGFDMRRVGEQKNWHSEHPGSQKVGGNALYVRFLRPFPAIAEGLKRQNIECVNATPGSALLTFPIVKPEEVLPCSPSLVS